MDNSKTNLTTSTWGSPYAEVSIIGKRKYARLLRVLVGTFASLCILTVLTTLSFVAFKLTTTDFESMVFDDGTPVKCVLSSKSDRPIPSVIYQPAK
ncbi:MULTISPECIES: hypothetical protein [Acinetobacter]|jgi:hypothetical protein|uniref:Uncharacterized protein n=3 Tax=Acinetobacter TaxID=469 RepID=A0A427UPQ9_ACIJO|nr:MULTISPECIES: hypothetical protein [Acinetobacter]ALV74656.1 hypothetical protein RZ95_17555 [Acinetobacter johnsonii XBB1]MCD0196672.1 hypothetical protein [Acinetobacter baumannii]MCE6081870.1 hypothetical protein [Acinetobacter pittii]MCE6396354.1 hypothetical protein [Acinetobacter pittii]MCU4373122.1 hypothetical protein [Acinetobacter ursingii]